MSATLTVNICIIPLSPMAYEIKPPNTTPLEISVIDFNKLSLFNHS